MMLRFSFGLEAEADAIEKAVDNVLDRGLRTADIIGSSGVKPLKTFEMTDEILKAI